MTCRWVYINNLGHVVRELLDAVESSEHLDGHPALRVHLSPEVNVANQIVHAKVVLATNVTIM
jgi:hypothetical protein